MSSIVIKVEPKKVKVSLRNSEEKEVSRKETKIKRQIDIVGWIIDAIIQIVQMNSSLVSFQNLHLYLDGIYQECIMIPEWEDPIIPIRSILLVRFGENIIIQ